MFQFGLFSTFIPYLIFAISYIGFLGYSALQKDTTFDFTDSVQQVQLKPANHYQISLIDFSCEKDNPKIVSNYTTNFTTCFKLIYCYPVILDVGDYKQEYHYQSIFSRPPPAVFS
ncbi:MAG: hypothetical protein R6V16_08450 [Bacteroidales bacterium]